MSPKHICPHCGRPFVPLGAGKPVKSGKPFVPLGAGKPVKGKPR